MEEAGLRRETADSYARKVTRLAPHVREQGSSLSGARPEELARALKKQSQHPSTQSGFVKALLRWYEFIEREPNPARELRKRRAADGIPDPLPPEELSAYIRAAEALGPRYQVLALVGSDAGLREGEARRCRWTDLRGDRMRVTGKGGHEGYAWLTPRLRAALASWRRHCPSDVFVLPGRGDVPISHAHLWRLHQAIIAEACVVPFRYHRLRHTAGTEALRASGGQLLVARDFLRHRSLSSTLVYVRVENVAVREAVQRMYTAAAL